MVTAQWRLNHDWLFFANDARSLDQPSRKLRPVHLYDAMTRVSVLSLVFEADDVGESPEGFVVIDGCCVNELDTHSPGNLTLHVQEPRPRGPTYRVVQ